MNLQYLLVGVIALLLIDLSQTLNIKNHADLHEINPILGEHPSDLKIILYFALCIGACVAAFLFAPTLYATIGYGIVAVMELVVIIKNRKLGL